MFNLKSIKEFGRFFGIKNKKKMILFVVVVILLNVCVYIWYGNSKNNAISINTINQKGDNIINMVDLEPRIKLKKVSSAQKIPPNALFAPIGYFQTMFALSVDSPRIINDLVLETDPKTSVIWRANTSGSEFHTDMVGPIEYYKIPGKTAEYTIAIATTTDQNIDVKILNFKYDSN